MSAGGYPKRFPVDGAVVSLRLMTAADGPALLAFAQTLPAHDLLFLRRDITRAEAIERAPQHNDEHARIAALGACEPRHLAPGEQAAGAEQRLAARWQMVAKGHAHLLWNSADMNSSTSACCRLSARPTACFTSGDSARLLTVAGRVTSTVMISSRAVYVDAAGDHVNGDVTDVYDKYDMRPEKRAVVNILAAELRRIIGIKPATAGAPG